MIKPGAVAAAAGVGLAAGLPGPAASAAHLAVVWGAEQVILPGLGVAPPLTEWGGKEIAIDAWHHLTYAAATGAAYETLNRMR